MVGSEKRNTAGRTIAGFLEICGWFVGAIGIALALIGFAGGGSAGAMFRQTGIGLDGTANFIATIPGIVVAVGGLFLVLQSQLARTQFDLAETQRELLSIAREGSSSDRKRPFENITAARKGADGMRETEVGEDKVLTVHAGQEILEKGGRYWVGERSFVSKWNAQLFIDGKLS